MRINKENIAKDDAQLAIDLLNKLKSGDRVFGSPAEGLKKTLTKLDSEAPIKDSFDDINYNLKDGSYEEQVAKLKKGIKGEEILSEYFEKILRLDRDLSDMIVFASLGDETTDKDYIPDTDFLCVYGSDILLVDAKNINTDPKMPLFVDGNGIFTATKHNEPILEVNSAVRPWEKILSNEYNGTIDSIHGCICIINKTGSLIYKNQAWVDSEIKPIHISELVEFLHAWIKDKEPIFDLNLLVAIAKQQIKTESSDLDLSYAKRVFKV